MRVIDLTQRLPGPLAGHQFQKLGAEVIKMEDAHYGDSFSRGFFSEIDPSFSSYYQALNRDKKIMTFDFSNPNDQKKIKDHCEKADIILMGLPPHKQKEWGLGFDDLSGTMVYCQMIGSPHHSKPLHDLNIFMETGYLDLLLYEYSESNRGPNFIAPPFYPFAGILFGAEIVQQCLYHLSKKQKKAITVSLEAALHHYLGPFANEEIRQQGTKKFLHNGAYPCYGIYPLKEKGMFVGVAAVEEKYWKEFTNLFDLPLSIQDRFSRDPQIFQVISQQLNTIDPQIVKEKVQSSSCCLSFAHLSNAK